MDVIKSYSFLYFSISFLLLVLFVLCLKWFLGGYTPQKVLRGLDNELSKSYSKQIFLLLGFIVIVFAFLFFLSSAITSLYIDNYKLPFWESLGHFLNPGNYRESNGVENGWVFIINFFGMVLMTGLLISVLANLLERRVDGIKGGRVHYKFNHHFVIIGYDKMTIGLVKQLHEKDPKAEIILQTIQDVPTVRHELFSHINTQIERKLTILTGNRNSEEDLGKLNLPKATEIYLLGEYDEFDHDSLNIESLKTTNNILSAEKLQSRKKCHVLFENQSTYAILQQRDIQGVNQIEFIPFNFQEKWAEKVFITGNNNIEGKSDDRIHYLPLDRVPIYEESSHTVHLIIVGMSKMGIALGIEATHLCHFPNFIHDRSKKTRITFIDKNADKEMYFLQGRYQNFFGEIDYEFEDINDSSKNFTIKDDKHFTDIEWKFIKGEIENPIIQQKIEDFSNEKNVLLTIAICLNNPSAAIAAGMYLRNSIYQSDKIQHFDQHKQYMTELLDAMNSIKNEIAELQKDIKETDNPIIEQKKEQIEDLEKRLISYEFEWNLFNVQVLIKQNIPHSILSMLEHTSKFHNVKPFGMLDNCMDILNSDNRDLLAKRVHYVYNYYFDDATLKQMPTSIPTNEKWQKILTVEKWSNRYHANMISVKQRSFDIEKLKNVTENSKDTDIIIDLLAKVEHNRWNTEKLLLGFRPMAKAEQSIPKPDLKKKFIHPDIKEFDDIPDDTKDIDRMISRALPLIIKKQSNERIQPTTN